MSDQDFTTRFGPAALVTGASSGIGRSFAGELAAKGLDLVLVARRVDRLEQLATQLLADHGVAVTLCPVDLAQPDAAARMIEATAAIDIGLVVSNAGFGVKGDHAANDPKAMSEMLMVNCHTPMLLAHGFIPRLRARGRGGLVFISSVEALIGCPFSTGYSATKGFVNNLGEGLWGELTPEGLTVLTVCPGATDTEALARAGIDRASMPNLMSPDDVARLAFDHIDEGPVYIPSDHYRAMFGQLAAMPRRDALTAMAASMKR
jgi:short-subunit dehydrogenase